MGGKILGCTKNTENTNPVGFLWVRVLLAMRILLPASAKQRGKATPGEDTTCHGMEWLLQLWEVVVPSQAARFWVSRGRDLQRWMDGLGTRRVLESGVTTSSLLGSQPFHGPGQDKHRPRAG